MNPTRVRTLAVIALVAGALGWSVAHTLESITGHRLAVPWLAAAAAWLIAAAMAYWTLTTRARLQRRNGTRPMPPLVAARTAALAMAASRAGAFAAGFYGGVAIAMVSSLTVPVAAQTFWCSALTSFGSIAVIAVALWLEHICRLPVGPDDQDGQRL